MIYIRRRIVAIGVIFNHAAFWKNSNNLKVFRLFISTIFSYKSSNILFTPVSDLVQPGEIFIAKENVGFIPTFSLLEYLLYLRTNKGGAFLVKSPEDFA